MSHPNKRQRVDGLDDSSSDMADFQADIKQLISYAKDIEEEEHLGELKFEQPMPAMVENCIISSFANKGGVGKTSLSIMMAEEIFYSKLRKRILLMDFDSQMSLTSMLESDDQQLSTFLEIEKGLIDPNNLGSWQDNNVIGCVRRSEITVGDFKMSCEEYLKDEDCSLDYMKGHIDHDYINNELSAAMRIKQPNFIMRTVIKLIETAKSKYDVIILDLNPSLSPLNILLMKLSTRIVSPTLPDLHATLSARALHHKFISIISEYDYISDNKPQFQGFIINRVRYYNNFIIKEMRRNLVKLQKFAEDKKIQGMIGTIKFMPSLSELLQLQDGKSRNLMTAGKLNRIPQQYKHLYEHVKNAIHNIVISILGG